MYRKMHQLRQATNTQQGNMAVLPSKQKKLQPVAGSSVWRYGNQNMRKCNFNWNSTQPLNNGATYNTGYVCGSGVVIFFTCHSNNVFRGRKRIRLVKTDIHFQSTCLTVLSFILKGPTGAGLCFDRKTLTWRIRGRSPFTLCGCCNRRRYCVRKDWPVWERGGHPAGRRDRRNRVSASTRCGSPWEKN